MPPYPLSPISIASRPRELGSDDLDDIVELHEAVHADHVAAGAETDHGLFARETREFFREHLDARGRIFGLHDYGRLIAYGVLGLPVVGSDNFGALVGLLPQHQERVAHVDGVAVRPSHRGQKLQLLMIEHRLRAAFDHGRDIVYTTVSPRNPQSLGNLLRSGFRIVGRRALFGGHDRFVMAWADPRSASDAGAGEMDLDDAAMRNGLAPNLSVLAGQGKVTGSSWGRNCDDDHPVKAAEIIAARSHGEESSDEGARG